MAIVAPSATTGKALYNGTQSFRAHDNAGDRKDAGGTYSHNNLEFSATECEEILDALRYVCQVTRQSSPAQYAYANGLLF
jgi:hypothetical protein